PDRWQQVESIFHAARERPAAEREGFLEAACAGDADLRAEVEALLGHNPSSFNVAGGSLTGRRFGSYIFGPLIGVGGMGEVYRARDEKLGREVAIKILPRAFATDAARVARFTREARVLAALNHPHIGAIYGLEEDDSLSGIVLELVD